MGPFGAGRDPKSTDCEISALENTGPPVRSVMNSLLGLGGAAKCREAKREYFIAEDFVKMRAKFHEDREKKFRLSDLTVARQCCCEKDERCKGLPFRRKRTHERCRKNS